MLLGGGSTREDADGKYEVTEIFIAIGCQTGNVLVFNMIGLLVYKVEMGLPIVALDWISDMSAPSVLPNQNRSLSTCFEDREEDYPVLKSTFAHYETSSSEGLEGASGTVMRKAVSPERPGARRHIHFDGGRDIFSPKPETSCLDRRRSEILNGPSSQFEAPLEPVRRRSFLRPRIATETFKDPSKSSIPRRPVPTAPTSPTAVSVQDALRRTDSRQVFDVFFADALRVSQSRSPSPSPSVYSQSSDSDMWVTPPTKQKPTGRSNPVGYRHASANIQAEPSLSIIRAQTSSPASPNFSRPLPSPVRQSHSPSPSRRVSFTNRSFSWEEGDDGHKWKERKSNLGERSPFPAPPGGREKRDFSFERGLHAQELRCEERYDEKKRGRVQERLEQPEKRKRKGCQPVVRRRAASPTGEQELREEHRRLREEMALLREEFSALRQALENSRSR